MKYTHISILLLLFLSTNLIAQSYPQGFLNCVDAVLYGPEAKKVKVIRPKFDCKPLKKIRISEGTVHYSGHLSHHLPARPNDEVKYQFKIVNGVLKEDSIKTTVDVHGGWGKAVGHVVSSLGTYLGLPISPKISSSLWDTIAREISGEDYKDVASALVAAIAVQSAAIEALPNGITIKQLSSGRFVDAYQTRNQDYSVVTRPAQSDKTQSWLILKVSGSSYRIQQSSTGRYLDAHTNDNKDFDVVTRHYQNNDTQIWILEKASNSRYRVKQKSSGRYLDAHGNANNDFRLVTRERQENQTQLWEIRLGCSNAGRRCIEGFADNLIPYSVVINK